MEQKEQPMRIFAITGTDSGLGKLIAEELEKINNFRADKISVVKIGTEFPLNTSAGVDDAVSKIRGRVSAVDCLINCAGTSYMNFVEKIPEADWDNVMDSNAKSIFMMVKAMINAQLFTSPGTILNIVSTASHYPMTHSLAYNASKGAAHIMTLQMARELKKTHNLTVFGVSPNKMHSTRVTEYVDNRVLELRGWTAEQAEAYQAAALPAGEQTDPQRVAEFIAFLLSKRERHKFLNGCVIPYGA